MTLGEAHDLQDVEELERLHSKPKLASTSSSTRSAILARSSMALRSLGHSKKVMRRSLPLTTVTGPLTSTRLWRV